MPTNTKPFNQLPIINICLKKDNSDEYSLHLNNCFQHRIRRNSLKRLLNRALKGEWQTDPTEGKEFGQELYILLNGNQGALDSLPNSLELFFEIPSELDSLPIELLADKTGFFRQQRHCNIYRGHHSPPLPHHAETRNLKLYYLAANPGTNKLDQESEKTAILSTTTDKTLFIEVDQLGSIESLERNVFKNKGYDIIHLSGHAFIDRAQGPIFCLENNTGATDFITPEKLWSALRSFPPNILFLSGCETGKADKNNSKSAFTRQLVEYGIPVVLGWGLSVGDLSATRFASKLYSFIISEKSLSKALSATFSHFQDSYQPWPLLRIFTLGFSLESPIVYPAPQRLSTNSQPFSHKLISGNVRVLNSGFTGRKQELQIGLSILSKVQTNQGLLIHGVAGIGKSCLAGQIIDTINSTATPSKVLILKGKLNNYKVAKSLFVFLAKHTNKKEGLEILRNRSEIVSFERRVSILIQHFLQKHPTIIFFDQFEDNLEQTEKGWLPSPRHSYFINTALKSVSSKDSVLKIIATSRHPITSEISDEDRLFDNLFQLPLSGLRDSDLENFIKKFPRIDKSDYRTEIASFSGGNPTILQSINEQLNNITNENEFVDLLSSTNDKYLKEHLQNIISQKHEERFIEFLTRSSVYNYPANSSAFHFLNKNDSKEQTEKWLHHGASLTLIEEEIDLETNQSLYIVTSQLRHRLLNSLTPKDQQFFNRKASIWYEKQAPNRLKDIINQRKAIDHALISKTWAIVFRQAYKWAATIKKSQRQDDAIDCFINIESELQESSYDPINEIFYYIDFQRAFISLLKETNQLELIETYARKLASLTRRAHGSKHYKHGIELNNLSEILHTNGKISEAEEKAKIALSVVQESKGIDDPLAVSTRLNLAQISADLGKYQDAERMMRDSLNSLEKKFGSDSPNLLPALHKLGTLLKTTNQVEESERLLRRTISIAENKYGFNHPEVLLAYNNLGQLLHDTGRLFEAEPLMRRLVKGSRETFGEDDRRFATHVCNLARLLEAMGWPDDALPLYRQGLQILEKSLGPKSLDVAYTLNNLSSIYRGRNQLDHAEILSRRHLEILRDFNQTQETIHPVFSTAICNYKTLLEELQIPPKEALTKLSIASGIPPTSLEKLSAPESFTETVRTLLFRFFRLLGIVK